MVGGRTAVAQPVGCVGLAMTHRSAFRCVFATHPITPARKFRMLLHTNPMRERGECLGTRARASEDR